jgi:hypothetical protein
MGELYPETGGEKRLDMCAGMCKYMHVKAR